MDIYDSDIPFLNKRKNDLKTILAGVVSEFSRAVEKHSPMHSHHEAYAVIAEEFEEYWREVQKGGKTYPRDPNALKQELTETAAMCLRALYDLC